MRAALRSAEVEVHFDGADPDHNRIVTAFSGQQGSVHAAVFAVAEVAFAEIDMRQHHGVHPRIGALDVCPFIQLGGSRVDALEFAAEVGRELGESFELPVFLYEQSETGKHAADLPALRKGQYEGLLGRALDADFGPAQANPRLGASVVGLRDWLIAMNVNLATPDPSAALKIASGLRAARAVEPFLAGVRALGFALESRGITQVSMNLTRPDLSPADAVVEWVEKRAAENRVRVHSAELIGVIRERDLKNATRLTIAPEQVINI